jgi:ComF family protein
LAAVEYGTPWAGLIQRFKFHGEIGWRTAFAHLMLRRLAHQTPSDMARSGWIVPVPMHPHALGQRGYNQGWLLCKALQKDATWGHLVSQKTVRHDVLLKVTHTEPQHRLGQKNRQINLAHAFAVAPNALADLQGRSITLVDDILTTGATLRAATTVLRQQGAAHVQVWVTARTPSPKVDHGGVSL